MKNENKNLQIRILRYADTNPRFTITELKERLNLMPHEVTFVQREVMDGKFFVHVSERKNEGYEYTLTLEGKSRLIEYDELIEARKSSQQAKWIAITAILISITVGIWQVIATQEVYIVNDKIKVDVISPLK